MTTNLYRIDDVLLRAGLIIGAFALLAVSAILSENGLTISNALGLSLLIACPLTLLAISRSIRRREKLMVEMWRLIEAKGQVPVQHLYTMTSFGRKQIAAAIERINKRGNAMLFWDETTDVIRDQSVQQHTLTHSEDCQSCGGSVNIEVSTNETDYVCPFCGSGLDSARINPLLEQIQIREGMSQQQNFASGLVGRAPKKQMSLVLFILLLMFFWPAAVIYALKVNSD